MGLLNIFKEVMQDALEVIFDEGKIWTLDPQDNGKGGYTVGSPTYQDCFALVGEVTERMKSDESYTDKSVGLFVLQTEGVTLNSDNELEVDGVRYTLGVVMSDPAKAAWEIVGNVKNG